FYLGEDLARPVMKGAHGPAFDFMRLESRRFELCQGVAPIRKWQLVLAPAEDAMHKNNFAGFETKTHCPSQQQFLRAHRPRIFALHDGLHWNDNASLGWKTVWAAVTGIPLRSRMTRGPTLRRKQPFCSIRRQEDAYTLFSMSAKLCPIGNCAVSQQHRLVHRR